jgi:hypothetical protein
LKNDEAKRQANGVPSCDKEVFRGEQRAFEEIKTAKAWLG